MELQVRHSHSQAWLQCDRSISLAFGGGRVVLPNVALFSHKDRTYSVPQHHSSLRICLQLEYR